MNNLTVELVQFKLKDGIDEDTLLTVTKENMEFVRKQNGYIGRELVKGPDGLWIDIVHWKSLSEAQEAEKKFYESTDCQNYSKIIDESSVKLMRMEQVLTFE